MPRPSQDAQSIFLRLTRWLIFCGDKSLCSKFFCGCRPAPYAAFLFIFLNSTIYNALIYNIQRVFKQFLTACLFLLRPGCKASLNPLTFLFLEGFPIVASCHWYGSRKNNRKLGKLYMVFKSTKCCLHFTSAFD